MTQTILLVEDNLSDEKLTVQAFARCGVANAMVVTRDGVEALDYLFASGSYSNRDASQLPAIVLLDLNLPRLDGLEVLRRMRSDDRTRLLPVIVLTSSKEQEDVLRSYALGANAYVRKPVDFTEFAKAAATLGMFWLLMNTPPPSAR